MPREAQDVRVPMWVVWTIVISMVGSGLSIAGTTIWGSSQAVFQVKSITDQMTLIRADLKDTMARLEGKVEKNSDRIFELNSLH